MELAQATVAPMLRSTKSPSHGRRCAVMPQARAPSAPSGGAGHVGAERQPIAPPQHVRVAAGGDQAQQVGWPDQADEAVGGHEHPRHRHIRRQVAQQQTAGFHRRAGGAHAEEGLARLQVGRRRAVARRRLPGAGDAEILR
jgi:hypothetical protein